MGEVVVKERKNRRRHRSGDLASLHAYKHQEAKGKLCSFRLCCFMTVIVITRRIQAKIMQASGEEEEVGSEEVGELRSSDFPLIPDNAVERMS